MEILTFATTWMSLDYVKWNKPDVKKNSVFQPICTILKIQPIGAESRMVVARDWKWDVGEILDKG